MTTSGFNSKLVKSKNFVKLQTKCRKLQMLIGSSEDRLKALDQNQQSIVEHYNQRMKKFSKKLKGIRAELQTSNNRIKILEQKLLSTSAEEVLELKPAEDAVTVTTIAETESCPDDSQPGKAQAETTVSIVSDQKSCSSKSDIDPKKFKEVKIMCERLDISRLNPVVPVQNENVVGTKEKSFGSPSSRSNSEKTEHSKTKNKEQDVHRHLPPPEDPNCLENDPLSFEVDVKPLICPICQAAVANSSDLETHTRSHSPIFECVLCDATFTAQEEFRKHIIQEHTKPSKTMNCSSCGLTFAYRYTLMRHFSQFHTSGNDFNCPTCSKTFKRKDQLNNHLLIHSGERPFPCSKCSKSYTRKSALKKHLTSHSSLRVAKGGITCELCSSKFTYNRGLRRHMEQIHGIVNSGRTYPCPQEGCDRTFTRKRKLFAHSNAHKKMSGMDLDDLRCSVCKIKFSSRYSLIRHTLRKHSAKDASHPLSFSPGQDLEGEVPGSQNEA